MAATEAAILFSLASTCKALEVDPFAYLRDVLERTCIHPARRVAESLRRTSGRAALAADAEHLLPVLAAAPTRDLFADPFADDEGAAPPRPVLVVLDDGTEDPVVSEQRGRLGVAADGRGVRVETVTTDAPTEVARYASLLLSGTYAAAYLRLGLAED